MSDVQQISKNVAYRPLGWWRFALAASVAYGHAAFILDDTALKTAVLAFPQGSAAVFAFFLLSGFILSEAMARIYADRPMAFVTNRALKILPTFIVALALSIAVHALAASQGLLQQAVAFERSEAPENAFGPVNLLLNLVSWLPSVVGSLLKSALDAGERYIFVRYVWAVRVEVVFYALLALSIFAASRRPELKRYGLAAIWLATALSAVNQLAQFSSDYAFSPYFIMGVCLYWQMTDPRFRAPGLAALPLALIHAYGSLDQSISGVLGLIVLLAASAALSIRTTHSRRFMRFDRMLGDVSYSLYLNQYAVLVAWSAFLPEARGPLAWACAVLSAVALAALLHVVVERPLVDLRRRVRQAAINAAPESENAEGAAVLR